MAKSRIEGKLVKSLEEALAFERGEKSLKSQLKELSPPAPQWSANKIRRLRELFGATQVQFASLLNVKLPTIRAWEQGTRRPADAANRLLQIYSIDPGLIKKLKEV